MYCFLVRQSKLSRLPAYLTVQFVRFYFKEKDAINAKILKVGLGLEVNILYFAFNLVFPDIICWVSVVFHKKVFSTHVRPSL